MAHDPLNMFGGIGRFPGKPVDAEDPRMEREIQEAPAKREAELMRRQGEQAAGLRRVPRASEPRTGPGRNKLGRSYRRE